MSCDQEPLRLLVGCLTSVLQGDLEPITGQAVVGKGKLLDQGTQTAPTRKISLQLPSASFLPLLSHDRNRDLLLLRWMM